MSYSNNQLKQKYVGETWFVNNEQHQKFLKVHPQIKVSSSVQDVSLKILIQSFFWLKFYSAKGNNLSNNQVSIRAFKITFWKIPWTIYSLK